MRRFLVFAAPLVALAFITHAASAQEAKDNTKPDQALVNGRLNVPGAPSDSQTVPAKFSERNDRLDHAPTMATPLALSDAQKRAIADAVNGAGAPIAQVKAKPAEQLPPNVAMHDLPGAATDEALRDLKYVRTPDRILLVRPSSRIVIGEIAK